MKLRTIILLAILFATVTGCSKKYTGDTGLVLLSGITATAGTITENITFKYDDSYHLTEYNDDYTAYNRKFKYDGTDRLIQMDTYVSKSGYTETVTYDYSTAGQVNVGGYFKSTPTSVQSPIAFTLTLNALKQVTKATVSNSANYSLYTYDASGNLATEAAYIVQGTVTNPSSSVAYSYDNQKNPMINVRGNMLNVFRQLMPDNVVKLVNSDLSVTNGIVNTVAYYYVFDASGFPATATQVSTASNSTTSNTATAVYTYIRK